MGKLTPPLLTFRDWGTNIHLWGTRGVPKVLPSAFFPSYHMPLGTGHRVYKWTKRCSHRGGRRGSERVGDPQPVRRTRPWTQGQPAQGSGPMTPSPPQGGPRVLNHVRFAPSPKSPRRSAAFIKGRCGNPKTLVTHYVLLNADITNPPTRAKGAKSPKGRDGQTGASLTARPLPSSPCRPAPSRTAASWGQSCHLCHSGRGSKSGLVFWPSWRDSSKPAVERPS